MSRSRALRNADGGACRPPLRLLAASAALSCSSASSSPIACKLTLESTRIVVLPSLPRSKDVRDDGLFDLSRGGGAPLAEPKLARRPTFGLSGGVSGGEPSANDAIHCCKLELLRVRKFIEGTAVRTGARGALL